jgi:hypothetical protein
MLSLALTPICKLLKLQGRGIYEGCLGIAVLPTVFVAFSSVVVFAQPGTSREVIAHTDGTVFLMKCGWSRWPLDFP